MSEQRIGNGTVGAALVVGGGIAGIQAALDLAESGIKVYLVEKASAIGGRMAQLDKTFPTNDCAMCTISPKLAECGRHPNIELITDAEVVGLRGEPGNFRAEIHRKARYVDLAKCTGCGDCAAVCPIKVPSEYDHGLAQRTAVYRQYAQAIPAAYAIEKRGVAPCRNACPAHQRAQGYVALIKERRYRDALRVILEDNPFPATCGRVCNHKCEDACNRGQLDGAVAICSLKRFVADREMPAYLESVRPVEKTRQQKVAIVGAGPAGLTAAHDLASLGYPVTVFEALPVAGGMPRVGIPEYRLPRDVLQQEVDAITKLGVELRTSSALGRDFTLDSLRADGYDAIFLAIGAHRSERLRVPGEESPGVLGAVEFLREVALGQRASLLGRVVVVGGGNTAMDAARTALRLGAEEVALVYRRSRQEMPADPWEVAGAEAEGVRLQFQAAPVEVVTDLTPRLPSPLGKGGQALTPPSAPLSRGAGEGPGVRAGPRVTALVCQATKLGPPDASGRRSFELVPGSEFRVPADWVIAAVSQGVDSSCLPAGLERTRRGVVAVDPETLATNLPGVFAGGDLVGGAGFVVEAVAAGHKAARSIHEMLSGERVKWFADQGLAEVKYSPVEVAALVEGGTGADRTRVTVPERLAAERRRDFREVEHVLGEEAAVAEAERCLACGECSECLECVYACKREAIDHFDRDSSREVEVGAVIVAAGFVPYDARRSPEYGFGRYANVLTGPQFERLISASGPTAGHVVRPSDHQEPKNIAFLQCVGSRDQNHTYCSSVCCMYATKEAMLALEHVPSAQIRIFQMDLRAFGKGFDAYFRRAQGMGIGYQRCRVATIKEIPGSKNLLVRHQTEDGAFHDEEFDIVVLSVGLERNPDAGQLASSLGIELGPQGFARTLPGRPVETTRPGVFVCGSFKEPKDIPDSVSEASAAAAAALQLVASQRGTLVKEKVYPPEIDVVGQEPRIGVFVCHCGSNIAGVVDVADVAEYAKGLPGVVLAEHNMYTCSADTLKQIQERVVEHKLNRVVVASCTPRTHEPLFQETIREVGLNPYLFEMANIRDQCSWVHRGQPAKATAKSRDLVRMAVARAATLGPLHKESLGLSHNALVVGGGVAGMSAALGLSNQGYKVCLVEREKELGGGAARVDGAGAVERLLEEVRGSDLVEVLTETVVAKSTGFVGNFKTVLTGVREPTQRLIEHGVTIVATGAQEYRGPELGLTEGALTPPSASLSRSAGEGPGVRAPVITQGDLTRMLNRATWQMPGDLTGVRSVVMVQCVGPWDKQEFYCSRLCCAAALENALKLKALSPEARIYILMKDMRAYGFKEELYTEARSKGVVFIRYTDERQPEVRTEGGRTVVAVYEPILGEDLSLPADLVVLSTALVPPEGVRALGEALKVPITAEGFFLEAHPKLRPVDFASEGIFLCGAAHYPKTLEEAISQGLAAAGRASTVLAKEELKVGGVVAEVTASKCAACLTCVRVCPYEVPTVGRKGVAEIEVARCQGCGVCAAECPNDAIQLRHYRDDQVLVKAAALLAG